MRPDRGPASGHVHRRLVDLEAEARFARERYQLYRAKVYGPRLTSEGRLRELERQSKLADRLLARGKSDCSQQGAEGPADPNVQAI